MDWFKASLVFFLICGFVAECCGSNNSYFEVVQRYERCVLNRLSRSSTFTEDDRVRMVKIANEVNHRMHLLHMDPNNAPNARSMLRLFASALANLLADGDVLEHPQRKNAYIAVIEICSSTLPRSVAEKLVQDVKGAFTSAENARPDGNEAPVLSRRRGMSSDLSGLISPDDHTPIQRSKRSPQAVAFSTFGGWQPTESLQTVLSNILLNSNTFLNVYKDGISPRDAIYYARSMVEAGLVNYHFSVVQDVLRSVSNALSTFPFIPQSEDFAFAISSSIASVFDARQLSFFADGVGIGNGLISKLQSMVSYRNPTVSFPTSSDGAASSFSRGASSSSQQGMVSRSQVNSGFVQSQQSSRSFTSSQNPGQNQNTRRYSSSQQESPVFSEYTFPETQPSAPNPEFSFPETQPSALNPEYQDEPPQYPYSGSMPQNPTDEAVDYSQAQEFSYDSSDSSQIPAQQPKISEEYPQSDQGSESAIPVDYIGDASGSSDTDTSNGQKADSDSRTEESGDQRFKLSEGSWTVNNTQISSDASTPLDSKKFVEAGEEKTPDNFENSQTKSNAESRNNGTSTTLSVNRTVFTESRDTQTAATVNIIATTTPYPYTTTSLDASKVADILLDDMYASLRTLNSSSEDEVKPQKDTSVVGNREYSESKPTTIPDEESRPKQETQVSFEPSFLSTSSPGTSEVTGYRNETQSFDNAPQDELDLRDPTLIFAEHVAAIATSTITLIRSSDNSVTLQDLCNKANELAPVVDIPPLDVCNPTALVDYLMNVMKTLTFILRSV